MIYRIRKIGKDRKEMIERKAHRRRDTNFVACIVVLVVD